MVSFRWYLTILAIGFAHNAQAGTTSKIKLLSNFHVYSQPASPAVIAGFKTYLDTPAGHDFLKSHPSASMAMALKPENQVHQAAVGTMNFSPSVIAQLSALPDASPADQERIAQDVSKNISIGFVRGSMMSQIAIHSYAKDFIKKIGEGSVGGDEILNAAQVLDVFKMYGDTRYSEIEKIDALAAAVRSEKMLDAAKKLARSMQEENPQLPLPSHLLQEAYQLHSPAAADALPASKKIVLPLIKSAKPFEDVVREQLLKIDGIDNVTFEHEVSYINVTFGGADSLYRAARSGQLPASIKHAASDPFGYMVQTNLTDLGEEKSYSQIESVRKFLVGNPEARLKLSKRLRDNPHLAQYWPAVTDVVLSEGRVFEINRYLFALISEDLSDKQSEMLSSLRLPAGVFLIPVSEGISPDFKFFKDRLHVLRQRLGLPAMTEQEWESEKDDLIDVFFNTPEIWEKKLVSKYQSRWAHYRVVEVRADNNGEALTALVNDKNGLEFAKKHLPKTIHEFGKKIPVHLVLKQDISP